MILNQMMLNYELSQEKNGLYKIVHFYVFNNVLYCLNMFCIFDYATKSATSKI